MDAKVAEFMAITDTSAQKAESYLKVCDGNLDQAVELFFDTGGADIDAPAESAPPPSLPARQTGTTNAPIAVGDRSEDDDLMEAIRASGGGPPTSYEDDEAMARRLQEELYGGGGGGSSSSMGMENGVRAPIAKTVETLLPEDEDFDDDQYTHPPVRHGRIDPQMRAGIFNQRTTVWDDRSPSSLSPEERARRLAEATGGASAHSSHARNLAELFRPPTEIMYRRSFEDARDDAKELEKWIIVNIQEDSTWACQILNRDIWRNSMVQQTIRENFIFLQHNRNSEQGRNYIRLYMANAFEDSFPHVAIIDPRTGEQVEVWKKMPVKPEDCVQILHEFLERFSLNVNAKNPVQRGPGGTTSAAAMDDNDDYMLEDDSMEAEEAEPPAKGKEVETSPFHKIASDKHHQEPQPGPDVTAIQFQLPTGKKIVRKFLVRDPVERLFEYVKADLFPGQEFDLMGPLGKKLIDILHQTIEEAGLKRASVMVEVVDEE